MAGPLTKHYAAVVRQRIAAWPEAADLEDLNELLRTLGRWRSKVIANTFISHHGARVLGGPFAGMAYVAEASEGALVPRLLGAYESELHPHLLAFAAAGLDAVIDVGCAEGYYAVGLARLMPQVTVHAYDIDEKARAACADLAAQNGVADRVLIGGAFAPDGFEAFAGRRVLVMVEGRMELDQWQDKQSGAKRSRLKVVAENVQFLRIKKPDDDPLADPAIASGNASLLKSPYEDALRTAAVTVAANRSAEEGGRLVEMEELLGAF